MVQNGVWKQDIKFRMKGGYKVHNEGGGYKVKNREGYKIQNIANNYSNL